MGKNREFAEMVGVPIYKAKGCRDCLFEGKIKMTDEELYEDDGGHCDGCGRTEECDFCEYADECVDEL